jgi:LysM repeat protein
MNRRQLAFLIIINALVSLVIALGVAWAIEARRPDPEELAVSYTPPAQVLSTPVAGAPAEPTPTVATSDQPTVAPTPVPIATTGEEEIYIVQAGDSLLAIAGRFGVSMADLVAANDLDNQDFIFSGQRLIIPVKGGTITNTSSMTTPMATTGENITTLAPQGIRVGALETPGNLLSEAVSIVNDSNIAFNLQGWRLEREGGPAYTFGDVAVFPGGNIWVHSRDGTNTSVALYWNQPNPIWQSGAVARLVNPEGSVVASYIVP